MTRGVFVTGTDTHVGKTWICLGLLNALRRHARRVGAMKPVASGGVETPDGIRNEDAVQLRAAANVDLSYEQVNPVVFSPPVAPHIAAAQAGTGIVVAELTAAYRSIARRCDWVVVEGVGGWKVPLNDGQTTADLAKAMDLPVIMVVGTRLGCLNHALLTAESIRRHGVELCGWVANRVDPEMAHGQDNVDALRMRIDAPLLGIVPYLLSCDPALIASCLDLRALGID